MSEQTIKPKSFGGFVRSLSGIFITKDNPNGLTPKELTVLAVLLSIIIRFKAETINKDHKVELSNQLNQNIQVTTNYINKFKAKGVVTREDKLHPIFFNDKITIDGTNLL